MTNGFTNMPVDYAIPLGDTKYVELVTIITVFGETKAWRFVYCHHHANEYLKLSRECGDTQTYYWFNFSNDTQFCPICNAIENKRIVLTPPQVSIRTFRGEN